MYRGRRCDASTGGPTISTRRQAQATTLPSREDPSALWLLDGGLATALEAAGHRLDDALWSARLLLDDPPAIAAVHRAYLRAGADVISTASYQAGLPGLMARGLSAAQARETLALSVRLARTERDRFVAEEAGRKGAPSRAEAASRTEAATRTETAGSAAAQADRPRFRPLVAASLGPYGALLADGSEYRGDYDLSPGRLRDVHLPRLEALLEAGPDLVALETLPALAEAELLLRLLERFPTARAWLSFSCRDAGHTARGEPLARAAELAAASPQVLAVGVNCVPPAWVEGALETLGAATALPLLAYPNRGRAWDAATRRWGPLPRGPALSILAPRWRAAGARLIGGCCGVGPEQIRGLRAALG